MPGQYQCGSTLREYVRVSTSGFLVMKFVSAFGDVLNTADVSTAVCIRLSMAVRTKVAKVLRLIVEAVAVDVIEFERHRVAVPHKGLRVELTVGIVAAVRDALLSSVLGVIAARCSTVSRYVAVAQDLVHRMAECHAVILLLTR